MTALLLFILAAGVLGVIGKRVSQTIVTPPMIFLALGLLAAELGFMERDAAEIALHVVAEVALVLLLFLDASQIDGRLLRQRYQWPERMLAFGLPLSIGIGALAAWPFLPGAPLVEAALVAALLAPTDAALGQAVVTNKAAPERARRALIVESGLNDGLALPAVLLFASLTGGAMAQDWSFWLQFGALQLTLGPLVGAVMGLIGGWALLRAKALDWTDEAYEGVGAVALAATAYLLADQVGGNGFIAAFVAGLLFGGVVGQKCKFVYEFTENEGQLLSWAAFFLIGLALLPEALGKLTWSMLGLILVSLLLVRPIAIWISLVGTDATPATRLFFGWFGPRGLATALFALIVVEELGHDMAGVVLTIAVNAVWISALLHGASALTGARLYGAADHAIGGEGRGVRR